MGIPTIFLLSGAAAVVAVIGFLVVHRLIKPIDLDEHQRFLDAMLNIVGTLVSILLGLLVAAALDRYHTLEQSVDMEAANVAQVFRLSGGLPEQTQKAVRQFCVDYCREVVEDEWPEMAKGKAGLTTFVTYGEVIATLVQFKPADGGESNLHACLLSAMQQIGDCRRQRLLSMDSTWTRHLMPMLLMCSAIVLAFAYLYMRRGAILHAVLICFVAIALGGNLGLVYLLSNPFSGEWKIQPRGFLLNARLLSELDHNPKLKKLYEDRLKAKEKAPSSPPAK